MIHRFCISHMKPLLPESWYDDCIALGDFQPNSRFHVSQLDGYWHQARSLVYGAEGTFVLPLAVELLPTAPKLIEISSYRKRILPSREGVESRSDAPMRELILESVEQINQLSTVTPGADLEFLVPQPLYFEASVVGHYAACHYRRDILDYVSLASELGILDSHSVTEFLTAKHFIPGGAQLGIYPRSWLVDTLTGISLVSKHFLQRYSGRLTRYNDYQIRAVGFLSERLGSFLLIRHLMEKYSNNIPADIFGHMTAVVEGSSNYSIAFADRSNQPRQKRAL